MTNLPYIPTEYSVKPGIKKLEDENHFIIDEQLPLYKNEKHDARAENLSQYYLERGECKKWGFSEIQSGNQKYLMKTICFWMAEQLSKEYSYIKFFSEDDYYVLDNAILKVIFIGLASLTFPHILLEYLIEKYEE